MQPTHPPTHPPAHPPTHPRPHARTPARPHARHCLVESLESCDVVLKSSYLSGGDRQAKLASSNKTCLATSKLRRVPKRMASLSLDFEKFMRDTVDGRILQTKDGFNPGFLGGAKWISSTVGRPTTHALVASARTLRIGHCSI